MPIAISADRPVPDQTVEQNYSLTPVLLDNNSTVAVDFKATINSAARLIGRLKITPEVKGQKVRFLVDMLHFTSSGAETYADARNTPFTDAEADNAPKFDRVGRSDWIDIDDISTLAGDIAGA